MNQPTNLKSAIFIKPVFILAFLIAGLSQAAFAQGQLSKTTAYASIGAVPGLEALINVETRLHAGELLTWYARFGAGFGAVVYSGGPGVLGGLTALTGRQNKHFELSGGLLIGKTTITILRMYYQVST